MLDVVIETKDGDLNEKGVSWNTKNALVDWFVSFKFDDLLLLFDPPFETKDDWNDLYDWSCNKEEELNDVEFAGNNDDVQFSNNHTFFWFIIPQIDPNAIWGYFFAVTGKRMLRIWGRFSIHHGVDH